KEDPAGRRIERRGLKVDLHPMDVAVRKTAKERATGLHEVLLDRADAVIVFELGERLNGALQPARSALEDQARERSSAPRREQVAIATDFSIELAITNHRERLRDVLEVRRQKPRMEAHTFANQSSLDATPDDPVAVLVRPDGDDAGRGVPAEEDLVIVGRAHR